MSHLLQSSTSTRWLALSLSIMAAAMISCGADDESAEHPSAERAFGSLRVPLVTPELSLFRLRDARFDVSRPGSEPLLTLDSESDLNATSLGAELNPGSYEMMLRDGWRLERLLGDAGAAAPVSAALLTANPLAFGIQNERVTELVYSFATEVGIVTFGRGAVSIGVGVTSTAPSGSCNLLEPSTCPLGQTCLMAGDSGRTFCAQPGSLPVGASCSADQCVAGAQCLNMDPGTPDERVCARFCDTTSLTTACDCRALAFEGSVGVCVPPPACDPTQNDCAACDPAIEVEFEGECYYLDGSGGTCNPGYTLAPQDILASIASSFAGKNYKHTVSGNCCIAHANQASELQDWGMDTNCNSEGPFIEGPVLGGAFCSDTLQTDPLQLTLCQTGIPTTATRAAAPATPAPRADRATPGIR